MPTTSPDRLTFPAVEARTKLQSLVMGRVIPGGIRGNPFDIVYPEGEQRRRRVAHENQRLIAAGYKTRVARHHRAISVLELAR